MNPHKTKLLIAYDGTDYSGWQLQPNGVSIQALIEKALQTILRRPTHLIGSGRTDAGVHAIGQVAHFKHEQPLDHLRLVLSLNGLLPPTIRILSAEDAPLTFHARFSAEGKIYHYHLGIGPIATPFQRLYRTQIRQLIDQDLLRQAAQLFVGTRDFTSFANEAHKGSASRNAVRTLKRLDVVPEEGGLRLEFESNGFLYKMVRNIAGTLIEVAKGKYTLDDIPKLFEARDRRCVGLAAPPNGLFLVKVNYPTMLSDSQNA